MKRLAHENVATVLVDPRVLGDLELAFMALDLRVWPVSTAPVCVDGARTAFQVRRRLILRQQGAWDLAAEWTPVWVSFGATWQDGVEPLPWAAHETLWRALSEFAPHVCYHRRLGGVPRLSPPTDLRSWTGPTDSSDVRSNE